MEKNAKGYKDMILLKRKRKKKKKNQISENKRYQHSKTTQLLSHPVLTTYLFTTKFHNKQF